MKFRKDFVTNSSSSSYICAVCGCAEAGYDINLRDIEMFQCAYGHIVCASHVEKSPKQIMEEILAKSLKNSDLDEGLRHDILIALDHAQDAEDLEDLIYEVRTDDIWSDLPIEYCPVCTLVSIPDYTMLRYIMAKDNLTQVELEKEIRENFLDFQGLGQFINRRFRERK